MIDMTNFFYANKTFESELLTHVAPMKEGETISVLAQSFLIPDIFRIVRHYGTHKEKPVEVFFQTINGEKVVKITRVSSLDINRSIGKLQVGESHTFKAPSDTQKRSIRNYAQKWTKMDAECTFCCCQDGDDMIVKRVEGKDIGPGRKDAYPEIDALEIGESYVFDLPRSQHYLIRLACTQKNKTLDVRYSANAVPEGIRVTRLPATYEERLMYSGTIQKPLRHSRWQLERLDTELRIVLTDVDPTEYATLRSSCAQKSLRTGWKIKCSIDRATGTATVTRCG